MSIVTDKYQVGVSSTAANNMVITAQAADGTAQIGMGMQDTGIVTPLMNMLATGVVNFPNGMTADKLSKFPAGVQIGPIGSGTGVVTNANGTAIQLPGGFILQFGTFTCSASGYSAVSFPMQFGTACLNVQVTDLNSGANAVTTHANTMSKSGFNVAAILATTYLNDQVTWFAIGY